MCSVPPACTPQQEKCANRVCVRHPLVFQRKPTRCSLISLSPGTSGSSSFCLDWDPPNLLPLPHAQVQMLQHFSLRELQLVCSEQCRASYFVSSPSAISSRRASPKQCAELASHSQWDESRVA